MDRWIPYEQRMKRVDEVISEVIYLNPLTFTNKLQLICLLVGADKVRKHADRHSRSHQRHFRGRNEAAVVRLGGADRPTSAALRRAHLRSGLVHGAERGAGVEKHGAEGQNRHLHHPSAQL